MITYHPFTSSRVVVQTWKTRHVTDPLMASMQRSVVESIRDTADPVKYVFYDDAQVDAFITTTYPQYERAYRRMSRIQQLDLFRYAVIYHYGGLYYDMDMVVDKPFDNFHTEACAFPIEFERSTDAHLHKQGEERLLGNYAFYSPANHPFLKLLIDNIVNGRIAQDDIPDDDCARVYYTTGPVMLTQTYIDFVRSDPAHGDKVKLLRTDPFVPSRFGEYARHLAMGSWKKETASVGR
jgi:mannosyltransferase OCH1-like enzyme